MRPYKVTATFVNGEVREVTLHDTTQQQLADMMDRKRFLMLPGEWWNVSKISHVEIREADDGEL